MSLSAFVLQQRDRWAAWFPVLLLTVLALMTYWLEGKVQSAAHEKRSREQNIPEQFLERFVAKRYTAEGDLSQQLSAVRATAFPQINQSIIESPVMKARTPNKPQQDITATTAVVIGKNERIEFSGTVLATQAQFKKNAATTITSERLTAYPNTHQLKTKTPVTIVQSGKTFTAASLDYNTQTQQFATGRVKIELDPGK
jgi:lipopolysaccharide export system protein LptC